MDGERKKITMRRLLIFMALTAAGTAVVALGVTALLINIFERKQEARNPFYRVVPLTDTTVNPAVWGKNFPQQYDTYLRTTDQNRTRFGGSEAVPRTPTEADPRSVVANSRLEEDPRLKIMWAGYAFSVDFREERGHAYMLSDQVFTQRQQASPQPGTCIHCHASTYVPYKIMGDGDLIRGFEVANQLGYGQAKEKMEQIMHGMGQKLYPVACIDCHDPETMALRVTRPGFLEGVRALAVSDDPLPHLPSIERWRQGDRAEPYDPNTMATRQEMRAFVCGQCHVEYYFKGKEKRLTYPWHNGLKADKILEYYDEVDFKDWTHAVSGAPVLKAQHPEFEMWSQGIHARAGVACADCHMPYMRVGAMKVSDHHVRSPLLNINNACQPCHNVPEEELKARAELLQGRTFAMRNTAMDALVDLIGQIEKAQKAGATTETLAAPRQAQRRAQFLIDFVEAENSMGFHASQESARLLNVALDHVRRGLMALAGQQPTVTGAAPVPTEGQVELKVPRIEPFRPATTDTPTTPTATPATQ